MNQKITTEPFTMSSSLIRELCASSCACALGSDTGRARSSEWSWAKFSERERCLEQRAEWSWDSGCSPGCSRIYWGKGEKKEEMRLGRLTHYFDRSESTLSPRCIGFNPCKSVEWRVGLVRMASARQDYVAPWWTYWLHNFPHANFHFQAVDSAFKPGEVNYQQVSSMFISSTR